MELDTLLRILNSMAPPELAEEWDSGIGLIVEGKSDVKKALVSLDVTKEVLKRAEVAGADIVIAHHPLFFRPVTRLDEYTRDVLRIALVNDISIFVMHTNYDRADHGINDSLGRALGFESYKIPESDYLRVAEMEGMEAEELAEFVSDRLETDVVISGDGWIERIGFMGGSGLKEENIKILQKYDIQAFISGELRHECLKYDMVLIDATHQATETPGMRMLVDRLPLEAEFYIPERKSVYIRYEKGNTGKTE